MENGIVCEIENCRKSENSYDLRAEVECENGTIYSKKINDHVLNNDEPFL